MPEALYWVLLIPVVILFIILYFANDSAAFRRGRSRLLTAIYSFLSTLVGAFLGAALGIQLFGSKMLPVYAAGMVFFLLFSTGAYLVAHRGKPLDDYADDMAASYNEEPPPISLSGPMESPCLISIQCEKSVAWKYLTCSLFLNDSYIGDFGSGHQLVTKTFQNENVLAIYNQAWNFRVPQLFYFHAEPGNTHCIRFKSKHFAKTTQGGIQFMAEFKYEVTERIAVLGTNAKGWEKQLNMVSWNDREPKYDIRDWSPDGSKMGKGVSLTGDELSILKGVLEELEIE